MFPRDAASQQQAIQVRARHCDYEQSQPCHHRRNLVHLQRHYLLMFARVAE